MDERSQFITLFVRDVEQFPQAYKQVVRDNPISAAQVITANLNSPEIKRLIRDLTKERRRLGA